MPDDVTKEEDEATELSGLNVERVDGVSGPATGQGFLVMKAMADVTGDGDADADDVGVRNEAGDAHAESNRQAARSNGGSSTEANEEGAGDDENQMSKAASNTPYVPARQDGREQVHPGPNSQWDESSVHTGEDHDTRQNADDGDGVERHAQDGVLDSSHDADRDNHGGRSDGDGDREWPSIEKHFAVAQFHDGVAKAKLSSKQRNSLPSSAFGYIEPDCTQKSCRHFPLPDANHVRNALARIAQGAKFGKQALPKVRAAAKRFGVDTEVSKAGAELADIAKLLDEGSDQGDILDMTTDEFTSLLTDKFAQFEQSIDGKIEKAMADRPTGPTPKPEDEPVAKADETTTSNTNTTDTSSEDAPVEKSSEDTDSAEVLKSVVADAVKEAVQPLEDRVEKMERRPRMGGPILRDAGIDPTNAIVRLRDDASNDTDEQAAIRKAMTDEPNAVKKADLARELQATLFRQMFA